MRFSKNYGLVKCDRSPLYHALRWHQLVRHKAKMGIKTLSAQGAIDEARAWKEIAKREATKREDK